MKLAIVCGGGILSGKEIMCLQLAEGLREAGHDVHFVTSRWGSGDFMRIVQASGFSIYPLWLGYISATLRLDCLRMTLEQLQRWPALLTGYRRFLRDIKPAKVIHTNWHHLLLLSPLLKSDRDVAWIHEVMPTNRQHRLFWTNIASRLGPFIAVSKAAGQALIDLGLPDRRVHVVHNAMQDPSNGNPSRSDKPPVIAIVGQIGAWKGHEDLIDAFRIVQEHNFEVQLHIFGNGDPAYESLLRDRIRRLGIEDMVIWRGFVQDRRNIYSDISVLVVPSRCMESFGLTALEAAFFALPVIASRRGGLVEVVEEDVTGLLFEPGNVDELADRITQLISNPERRQQMGRQARERAVSLFARDRFVRRFVNVLTTDSVPTPQ